MSKKMTADKAKVLELMSDLLFAVVRAEAQVWQATQARKTDKGVNAYCAWKDAVREKTAARNALNDQIAFTSQGN